MTPLTSDQRWLLERYDPSLLEDLILTPEHGLSQIKSRRAGGTARHTNGPEWLRWYDTHNGIHGSDAEHKCRVSLTYPQLTRWAARVPDDVREKLARNRAERRAEGERTSRWCMCGHSKECLRSNAGDPLWGDRHHPTDREYNKHLAEAIRLRTYLAVYISQAIWHEVTSEQLDLFEAAEAGTG